MRVGVVRPDRPVIQLVEAPDPPDERWAWTRGQVGGELDYNTLGGWSRPTLIVQMIVDDWGLFKGLPPNPVATDLYQTDWEDVSKDRSPGIVGTVVLEAADRTGEQVPLPSSVIDRWILAGFQVEGP